MKRFGWTLLLAAGMLPAAYAQFQFSVVAGDAEQPIVSLYDFGRVASGDVASARFRLRNTSNAAATLTLLVVAGTGFTLSSGPSLPAVLMPQMAADFTVIFTGSLAGSYSALFSADGISALLAAEVVPGLTFQVETAAGKISLGNSVDFGPAPLGQGASLRFDISNLTGLPLPFPAIAVSNGDFAFSGAVPTGLLPPGQAGAFGIQFLPTTLGPRSATLTIGAHDYGLTGTGLAPNLPKPRITINLPHAQSAQQGLVQVTFDGPAAASGSGTLTLAFQSAVAGAADPVIAFASGGLTTAFTFGAGDTLASFGGQPAAAFQTGTTAGVLQFTAQLAGVSASQSVQQTVTIAATSVGVTATQASRSTGSVTIQLDGFDNTQTTTALSFLFLDAEGNRLAGPIGVDAGPAFQSYFGGSNTGGSFVLRAVFPVTGDSARIASFVASLTNQAGTTTTARITF